MLVMLINNLSLCLKCQEFTGDGHLPVLHLNSPLKQSPFFVRHLVKKLTLYVTRKFIVSSE